MKSILRILSSLLLAAALAAPGASHSDAAGIAAVGDIDGDGVQATPKDAMCLARYIAGWDGYDRLVNLEACDIDRDGAPATVRDAVILARYIAGWEEYERCFASPEYTEAGTVEEYGSEIAKLIKKYSGAVDTSGLSDDEIDAGCGSGRLIVSCPPPLPLGNFVPAAVIRQDDDFVIQFDDAKEAIEYLEYLESRPEVRYAEFDRIVTAFGGGGDNAGSEASAHLSWGVEATAADRYAAKLAGEGKTGGVAVAVVDTGVDPSHGFLTGRLLSGYDFVDGDDTPQDGNSHGTHVSGTVVDCTPGLGVYILPVRVLDDNGSGYISQVALGIRYAAEKGAKVINLSLGGGHSMAVDSAVEQAAAKNVVVVKAAGNDASDTSGICPAHIAAGITVAAVDQNLSRAGFSNYGAAVDIAAPGVGVRSSVPGGNYSLKNGTSMAAPHVAAAAAMLLIDDPDMTPAEVEMTLTGNASDLGDAGWDVYYGAGMLDLSALAGFDTEGQCGDDMYWKFDEGTLGITGEGDMWDYDLKKKSPWTVFSGEIKKVVFAPGITSIGSYAFSGCDKISGELEIPEGVTKINKSAFAGCGGLTGDLRLPASLKSIGYGAFSGCSGLTAAYFYCECPTGFYHNTFEGTSEEFTIYYPYDDFGWEVLCGGLPYKSATFRP